MWYDYIKKERPSKLKKQRKRGQEINEKTTQTYKEIKEINQKI